MVEGGGGNGREIGGGVGIGDVDVRTADRRPSLRYLEIVQVRAEVETLGKAEREMEEDDLSQSIVIFISISLLLQFYHFVFRLITKE